MYGLSDMYYEKALRYGWTITISPHNGNTFAKGPLRLWYTQTGWRSAEVGADGTHTDHKTHPSLMQAFHRSFGG